MKRVDLYLIGILSPMSLGLTVCAVVVLWQWKLPIILAFLSIVLLLSGLRGWIWWQHHSIDLLAKRNRAMVVHESDQGFGYVAAGQIAGYTHASQTSGLPALPAQVSVEEEETACDYPKNFEEMRQKGYIAPGADFVPAFDDEGEPIRMPLMRSMGISGGQGYGKTVTTLLIMLEMIAKFNGRVRFLVADPHMYVAGEESLVAKVGVLRPFFLSVDEIRDTVEPGDYDYQNLLTRLSTLQNPAAGGEELVQWMNVIETEFLRRQQGKTGNVWVIVMDEFAGIMSTNAAKSVARVLEQVNQQARKMDMFALLISQEWKATRTGGSELRHSVVSFVVHNTPEAIAELIIPKDEAPKAVKLGVGEILVYYMGRVVRGKVPYTTEKDAESLLDLYAPWRPVQPIKIREVRGPEMEPLQLKAPEQAPMTVIPPEYSKSTLLEVRASYGQGLSEVDIAKKVFGVKSGPELAEAKINVRHMLEWMVVNAGWDR